MGQCESAKGKIGRKRLDFHQWIDVAACRVTVVADGGVAAEPGHLRRVGAEIVTDMAKRAVRVKGISVIADDAGGFLTSVLKRMKAERCEHAGLVASEDAEDAAFLVKAVKRIVSC